MGIEKKIERIRVELAYLIEGGGTLAEKEAAVAKLKRLMDAMLDAQAARGTE